MELAPFKSTFRTPQYLLDPSYIEEKQDVIYTNTYDLYVDVLVGLLALAPKF